MTDQKEKQIQISQSLFSELASYFLLDREDPESKELIKKGLSEKLDSMVKHELYTKYKTAPTIEQKEKARQDYLDKAGVSESFRW